MGGVPVVKADIEFRQITSALRSDFFNQLLRRQPLFLRVEHDRRAVCIISADKMNLVALQTLETHPNISLDVFHEMADMKRRVSVGECSRDEKFAGHQFSGGIGCASAILVI